MAIALEELTLAFRGLSDEEPSTDDDLPGENESEDDDDDLDGEDDGLGADEGSDDGAGMTE